MEDFVSPGGMQNRTIISKRLKHKKRKRIAWKMAIIFLLISMISFSGYVLVKKIKDKTFNVKHIMVVGNDTVNSKTVIEALRIPVGTCILTIDMNRLYQNVSERIDCRYLLISKKYPDTIVINIEEYPILFAVIEDNQVFYMDEHDRIVEKSDYLLRTDIPIVSGVSGLSKMEVGMTAKLKPSLFVEDIRKILIILANSGYDDKLSEIILNTDRTIKIITKNNLVIYINDLNQFKKQYDYIGSIIKKNKSNMELDLTQGDEPIVKNR